MAAKSAEHSCASTGLAIEQLWNKPFNVDVRDLLQPGRERIIAVRVHNSMEMGGIWQSVRLVGTENGISSENDLEALLLALERKQ